MWMYQPHSPSLNCRLSAQGQTQELQRHGLHIFQHPRTQCNVTMCRAQCQWSRLHQWGCLSSTFKHPTFGQNLATTAAGLWQWSMNPRSGWRWFRHCHGMAAHIKLAWRDLCWCTQCSKWSFHCLLALSALEPYGKCLFAGGPTRVCPLRAAL